MKYTRLTKDERRIMCEINKDGKNNPWKLGIPRETVRKSAQRLQALGLVTFYETLDPENDYTISLTGEGEAYMGQNPRLRNPLPDDVRAGLIQLAVSVVSVALGFVLGRI